MIVHASRYLSDARKCAAVTPTKTEARSFFVAEILI